jgi:hypothetical protein
MVPFLIRVYYQQADKMLAQLFGIATKIIDRKITICFSIIEMQCENKKVC